MLRSLSSLDTSRLLNMTEGMKIPAKDLREACEREISELGGSLMDSGVWRIPKS